MFIFANELNAIKYKYSLNVEDLSSYFFGLRIEDYTI